MSQIPYSVVPSLLQVRDVAGGVPGIVEGSANEGSLLSTLGLQISQNQQPWGPALDEALTEATKEFLWWLSATKGLASAQTDSNYGQREGVVLAWGG